VAHPMRAAGVGSAKNEGFEARDLYRHMSVPFEKLSIRAGANLERDQQVARMKRSAMRGSGAAS